MNVYQQHLSLIELYFWNVHLLSRITCIKSECRLPKRNLGFSIFQFSHFVIVFTTMSSIFCFCNSCKYSYFFFFWQVSKQKVEYWKFQLSICTLRWISVFHNNRTRGKLGYINNIDLTKNTFVVFREFARFHLKRVACVLIYNLWHAILRVWYSNV